MSHPCKNPTNARQGIETVGCAAGGGPGVNVRIQQMPVRALRRTRLPQVPVPIPLYENTNARQGIETILFPSGFRGRTRLYENTNARQGIETSGTPLRDRHQSSCTKTQMPVRALRLSTPGRGWVIATAYENTNARQGIETPRGWGRIEARRLCTKTQMPVRALRLVEDYPYGFALRCVRKHKCPSGH